MKINLVGNIFGTSGYASHCKQLLKSLVEMGHNVHMDTPSSPGWERLVNDIELNAMTKQQHENAVTVAIMQPPHWRLSLADNPSKFYGFVVYEGGKIPKYWMEYLLDPKVDGIIVPSIHVRNAILNTKIDGYDDYPAFASQFLANKIHIVPHGVDMALFKPRDESREDDKFTFVCTKGWTGDMEDRGGVQYVLRAFAEEFKKEEAVRLIVKLNPAYIPPGFDINKIKAEMNLPEDKAEILLNNHELAYNIMPEFYQKGDVYVCATRGEAFNIPGLEAKACGLPTIQTNYGGQTDYMTSACDYPIEYKLEEVTWDMSYEGIKWATPSITHLKGLMRWLYNNKNYVKTLRKVARSDASKFTWDKSAEKIIKIINGGNNGKKTTNK